jgi:hypothetical protein
MVAQTAQFVNLWTVRIRRVIGPIQILFPNQKTLKNWQWNNMAKKLHKMTVYAIIGTLVCAVILEYIIIINHIF